MRALASPAGRRQQDVVAPKRTASIGTGLERNVPEVIQLVDPVVPVAGLIVEDAIAGAGHLANERLGIRQERVPEPESGLDRAVADGFLHDAHQFPDAFARLPPVLLAIAESLRGLPRHVAVVTHNRAEDHRVRVVSQFAADRLEVDLPACRMERVHRLLHPSIVREFVDRVGIGRVVHPSLVDQLGNRDLEHQAKAVFLPRFIWQRRPKLLAPDDIHVVARVIARLLLRRPIRRRFLHAQVVADAKAERRRAALVQAREVGRTAVDEAKDAVHGPFGSLANDEEPPTSLGEVVALRLIGVQLEWKPAVFGGDFRMVRRRSDQDRDRPARSVVGRQGLFKITPQIIAGSLLQRIGSHADGPGASLRGGLRRSASGEKKGRRDENRGNHSCELR